MKPKSIKSILAVALLAPGALFAATATTTPVGYETTEQLIQNQFNLIGIRLHNPTLQAGVITAETDESVTVAGASFDTLLTSGTTYVLELENGVIQEITSWTATTLTTPQDITASVVPNTTKFRIRKASTVADIFGAANQSGMQATPDGDSATADLIFIPNGSGFDVVFYDESTPGWVDTLFNDATNKPIVYTDGIIIQRKGADKTLTISGEVKVTPTQIVTENVFTYFGSVYPSGSTIGNSSLEDGVQHTPDGDSASADLLYLTNGTGAYNVAFYDDTTPGWVDTLFEDQTNTSMTSGFIIQRRSASPYTVTLTPPSFYSSL